MFRSPPTDAKDPSAAPAPPRPASAVAPTARPGIFVAILVTMLAAAFLGPEASARMAPPTIAPELFDIAVDHPEAAVLSLRLMRVDSGTEGDPRLTDLYSMTLVPGIEERGLPTSTIEVVPTVPETQRLHSTRGVGVQRYLAQPLAALKATAFRPDPASSAPLAPGTRLLRVEVHGANGARRGLAYVVESEESEAALTLFKCLDARIRAARLGAGGLVTAEP